MSAASIQPTKGSDWTSVSFGQVATLINGRAYKKSELLDEGTPVLRIQNLNGGDRWYYSDLELPPDKYCDRDDLLFAWSASFGPYIWGGGKVIYHYHIWKVIPGPDLDKRFAFRLLGFLTQSIKDAAHGVAMLHITKGKMEAWEVSLPTLAEQKRIAGILDAADALRAKRRESLAQLDTLLQSTFLEMFGDPVRNPMGWSMGRLSDIVERLDGGKNVAQSETETDFRVLKVSAVTSGQYRPDESKYLPADFEVPESYLVRKGDLLISRANTTELVGATAYVWETPENIALPDKIWKFIWKKAAPIEPLFIYHVSQDEEFRRILGSRASGTSGSMKNIAKPKLLSLPIPLPPLDLQHRFVAIVESIEKQKATQRAHLDELDTLFASLQSRAFRGDL